MTRRPDQDLGCRQAEKGLTRARTGLGTAGLDRVAQVGRTRLGSDTAFRLDAHQVAI